MDFLFASASGRASLLALLLAVVTLLWWVTSRRSGTMRTSRTAAGSSAPRIDLSALGGVPGSRATFVQFSSQTCSPCRQVARVLTDLGAREDGVVHVELDVDTHPELVRTHGVLRTPTVFLLGPGGEIHGRTSGPMTPGQAREALEALDGRTRPAPLPIPHGRSRAVATSKDTL